MVAQDREGVLMPRIRSIHPGFLTDEAVMDLTVGCPLAPLFLVGLWIQSDDHGIFEWKPLTMKARILPAISGDIASIFEALQGANVILKFSVNGRDYGAIRNFCRFQRPKSPKYAHPMPTEIGNYVGFANEKPEPEDDEGGSGSEDTAPKAIPIPQNVEMPTAELLSFPQNGEIGPQRKEEGGKVSKKPPSLRDVPPSVRGSRLPADWTPGDEGWHFASDLGLDPNAVLGKFRDYWAAQPGQKGVKVEWQATWRNWCRTDAERRKGKPGAGRSAADVFGVGQDDWRKTDTLMLGIPQ
jgi:hypothetical protein